MAGILATAATAAIPSLVSKLFGGSKKTQTSRTNFKQLRDDALAAGFNPLTALRATGGQGHTIQTQAISSKEFLRNALVDGATAAVNYDPLAKRRQQLEIEILEAERDNLRRVPTFGAANTLGFPAPPQIGEDQILGGPKVGASKVRPPVRRDLKNVPRLQVISPSGDTYLQIPADPARRLGITHRNEQIMVEDLTALIGDMAGEGMTLLSLTDIAKNMGVPVQVLRKELGGNIPNLPDQDEIGVKPGTVKIDAYGNRKIKHPRTGQFVNY